MTFHLCWKGGLVEASVGTVYWACKMIVESMYGRVLNNLGVSDSLSRAADEHIVKV